MIVLDTHIWIWWVDENPQLSPQNREIIQAHQASGLGISIISCWEIAKSVEKNKLNLQCSVEEWLELALNYPNIQLLELSIPIILQSIRLSGFNADPADQNLTVRKQSRSDSNPNLNSDEHAQASTNPLTCCLFSIYTRSLVSVKKNARTAAWDKA